MWVRGLLAIGAVMLAPRVLPAQEQVQANPTRPSATDNAYLAAYGYTELEFGASFVRSAWSLPTLAKFAVHPKMELGVLFSGLLDHVAGKGGGTELGTPGVQLKGQFLQGEWGAIAVTARMEWPKGAPPQYTVYGVISRSAETIALDATFGGVFPRAGADKMIYAIALAPSLQGPVGGYMEIFGERTSGANPISADLGLSYAVSHRFVLDAAVAFGITEHAPDWQVQVGLTRVLARVLQ